MVCGQLGRWPLFYDVRYLQSFQDNSEISTSSKVQRDVSEEFGTYDKGSATFDIGPASCDKDSATCDRGSATFDVESESGEKVLKAPDSPESQVETSANVDPVDAPAPVAASGPVTTEVEEEPVAVTILKSIDEMLDPLVRVVFPIMRRGTGVNTAFVCIPVLVASIFWFYFGN